MQNVPENYPKSKMLFTQSHALPTSGLFASCPLCIDDMDAIAMSRHNAISIYTTCSMTLLYTISTLHVDIHRLFYSRFGYSLITLEKHNGNWFLCVYQNWKKEIKQAREMKSSKSLDENEKEYGEGNENKVNGIEEEDVRFGNTDEKEKNPVKKNIENAVQGYMLPLPNVTTMLLSVCAYTGRVIVGMEQHVNIWQCCDGFFQHVFEYACTFKRSRVCAMTHVAIHGPVLAVATLDEVYIVEIHVQNYNNLEKNNHVDEAAKNEDEYAKIRHHGKIRDHVLTCDVENGGLESMIQVDVVQKKGSESKNVREKQEWTVDGTLKIANIRCNTACGYVLDVNASHFLLYRFQPSHVPISFVSMLPETVLGHSMETYTRVLVATEDQGAHVYDFLHVKESRKEGRVYGKEEGIVYREGNVIVGKSTTFFTSMANVPTHQHHASRVCTYYPFTAPVVSITANSSYLFAKTQAGLEVWSLYSPRNHDGLKWDDGSSQQSYVPVLIGIQTFNPGLTHTSLSALDEYVVMMQVQQQASTQVFELRSKTAQESPPFTDYCMLILRQAPPPLLFRSLVSTPRKEEINTSLLLSLFSLFHYRAGICQAERAVHERIHVSKSVKNVYLKQLEVQTYVELSQSCAEELGTLYLQAGDIRQAVLFYAVSQSPPSTVLQNLRNIQGKKCKEGHNITLTQIAEATTLYLDAVMFPSFSEMDLHANSSKGQEEKQHLTRNVLNHFGAAYAPEEMARLVIDSALIWSLEDIELCIQKFFHVPRSFLELCAKIVLLERASRYDKCTLDAFFDDLCNELQEILGRGYSMNAVLFEHLFSVHPELLFNCPGTISETGRWIRQFYFHELFLPVVCQHTSGIATHTRFWKLHDSLSLFGTTGLQVAEAVQSILQNSNVDMVQISPELRVLFFLQHYITAAGALACEDVYWIAVCKVFVQVTITYLCRTTENGPEAPDVPSHQATFFPLSDWKRHFLETRIEDIIHRYLTYIVLQIMCLYSTVQEHVRDVITDDMLMDGSLPLSLLRIASSSCSTSGITATMIHLLQGPMLSDVALSFAKEHYTELEHWRTFWTCLWSNQATDRTTRIMKETTTYLATQTQWSVIEILSVFPPQANVMWVLPALIHRMQWKTNDMASDYSEPIVL